MVTYGGTTANGNAGGKPMPRTYKCSNCGRTYAVEIHRNSHQRQCYEQYGGIK